MQFTRFDSFVLHIPHQVQVVVARALYVGIIVTMGECHLTTVRNSNIAYSHTLDGAHPFVVIVKCKFNLAQRTCARWPPKLNASIIIIHIFCMQALLRSERQSGTTHQQTIANAPSSINLNLCVQLLWCVAVVVVVHIAQHARFAHSHRSCTHNLHTHGWLCASAAQLSIESVRICFCFPSPDAELATAKRQPSHKNAY